VSEEKAMPTVVISSESADDEEWWVDVLPGIRKYFREHGLGFQVELLKGGGLVIWIVMERVVHTIPGLVCIRFVLKD